MSQNATDNLGCITITLRGSYDRLVTCTAYSWRPSTENIMLVSRVMFKQCQAQLELYLSGKQFLEYWVNPGPPHQPRSSPIAAQSSVLSVKRKLPQLSKQHPTRDKLLTFFYLHSSQTLAECPWEVLKAARQYRLQPTHLNVTFQMDNNLARFQGLLDVPIIVVTNFILTRILIKIQLRGHPFMMSTKIKVLIPYIVSA